MRNLAKILSVFMLCAEGAWAAEEKVSNPTFVDLEHVDSLLEEVTELIQTRHIKIRSAEWTWSELENFHNRLFETMALDPARLDSEFIPAELEPEALTQELALDIDKLQDSRHIAEAYGAAEAFDAYIEQCREILTMRMKRLYSKSRHIAKKGVLSDKYENLMMRLREQATPSMELAVTWNDSERRGVQDKLEVVHAELTQIRGTVEQNRSVASMTDERTGQLKNFFWGLLPLFFVTGFIGGRIFGRQPRQVRASERSEPRV